MLIMSKFHKHAVYAIVFCFSSENLYNQNWLICMTFQETKHYGLHLQVHISIMFNKRYHNDLGFTSFMFLL